MTRHRASSAAGNGAPVAFSSRRLRSPRGSVASAGDVKATPAPTLYPNSPLRIHRESSRWKYTVARMAPRRRAGFKWMAMSGEDGRRLERLYRGMVSNSADPIAVLDRDGTIRFVTDSIERLTGFTAAELIGRPPFELVHPA